MLLQDLFKEENKNLIEAYSIVIDEASSESDYATPPENLEDIGFIFKIDEDGMMAEDLMDIVISYRLTQLPVLIEVPTQLIVQGKVDVKYLIQLASNVDFSVSILPPGHECVGNEITTEDYKNVILSIVDELLNRPNFDKYVYPVLNFFEYLMLEQVLGSEKLVNFRPENKYVQENFASLMTKEDSDAFKLAIRNKLYDFYGSKEDFELIAKVMIESVCEKTKDMYKSGVESFVANQAQAKNND